MDDGERIPIDIGPVAEIVENGVGETPGETPNKTPSETLREDGSLVIDLMAQPSCHTGDAPDGSDEIVVCAEREDDEGPIALRIQITENADATLISNSTKMPMGGSEHQAKVRLRLEF